MRENWDVKKHHVSCIIGYFCFEYAAFYNTPYIFVPKNPNPYSCKECKDCWSLLAAFNGDAVMIRKYIHWLFHGGLNKSADIVSFAYINTPGLIRRFNLYYNKRNVLSRETKLSDEFVAWCKIWAEEVFKKYAFGTMNDLGSLLGYYSCYLADTVEDTPERRVIMKAKEIGLITKDYKLNIGGMI